MRQKTERRYTPVMGMMHFAEKITEQGTKPMFKYYGKKGEILEIDHNEFSELVHRQIAGLISCGLADKRIAIIGETSVEWVASFVAIIAAGGVAVPMDKELSIPEIEGFFEMGGVEAVIFSRSFNSKFADTVKKESTVKTFIPLELGEEHDGLSNILSYEQLIEQGKTYLKNGGKMPEKRVREDMSIMLFTSGTTGTSKAVMLSEKNMCAAINVACETVEFFPEDVIVSVLPIHHTYEICCLLAGANYGMTIGINDSLKHVLKSFKTFKPTGIALVPLFVSTMNKKINDEAKKSGKDKMMKFALKLSKGLCKVGIDLRAKLFRDVREAFGGRLVKIVSGAAPLNPELVEKFAGFGIDLYEGYGITECSPLVAVNPYYKPKKGSVGPAVPCCTIKIDGDTVNALGYTEGEILVKGDNVMLGYYNNEAANSEVFTPDRYFRTGDIGYLDNDGYLFITGRKKFVIISDNGKNVYPEELEDYIGELECVGECVVLGRNSEESGEVVITALVYPSQEWLEDKEAAYNEIKKGVDAINKKLPSYKQIRAIELRDTEFEKTTTRKIKRHLVK